ncbi:MAG: response regulator transcription factor, partial [Clostridia bacterium]|nr:response regulator transcription factor [Clostridia bacterium]
MAVAEHKQTILVVDDDPEIVSAISKLLEMEGYSVLKAYDGLEALDLLSENDVHLILMDLMMPHMDGLSAVMRIRQTRNIPIIILSARTEDSDKILGLNVGADDYISKPYNPMELLARIGSQLRRYFKLGASSDAE